MKFHPDDSCCRGTVAPLAPANADELHWLRRPVPTLLQRATIKTRAASTRHCGTSNSKNQQVFNLQMTCKFKIAANLPKVKPLNTATLQAAMACLPESAIFQSE
jgi:hypothetical protein